MKNILVAIVFNLIVVNGFGQSSGMGGHRGIYQCPTLLDTCYRLRKRVEYDFVASTTCTVYYTYSSNRGSFQVSAYDFPFDVSYKACTVPDLNQKFIRNYNSQGKLMNEVELDLVGLYIDTVRLKEFSYDTLNAIDTTRYFVWDGVNPKVLYSIYIVQKNFMGQPIATYNGIYSGVLENAYYYDASGCVLDSADDASSSGDIHRMVFYTDSLGREIFLQKRLVNNIWVYDCVDVLTKAQFADTSQRFVFMLNGNLKMDQFTLYQHTQPGLVDTETVYNLYSNVFIPTQRNVYDYFNSKSFYRNTFQTLDSTGWINQQYTEYINLYDQRPLSLTQKSWNKFSQVWEPYFSIQYFYTDCLDTVTGTNSLQDVASYLEVNPNPFTDLVSIAFPGQIQLETIELFNTNGAKCELPAYNSDGQFLKIDLSHLSAGLYFLKGVTSSGIVAQRKVIKL